MKRKSDHIIDLDSIYCPRHDQPLRGVCTHPDCTVNRFICAQCKRTHPPDHQLHIEFIEEVFDLEFLSKEKLGRNIAKVQQRVKFKSQMESKTLKKLDLYFEAVKKKLIDCVDVIKNQAKAKVICISNNTEEYHLIMVIKTLQEQLARALGSLNFENLINEPLNEHLQNYQKVDKAVQQCKEMLKQPLIEFPKVLEGLQKQLYDLKMQIYEAIMELGQEIETFKPFRYHLNHISFCRTQETPMNIGLRNSKNITLFGYIPSNQMLLLGNIIGELKAFKVDSYESILSTKLEEAFTCICDVPERKEVYLGGINGAFRKVMYSSKPEFFHLDKKESNILAMAFLPSSNMLAISQINKTITFENIDAGLTLEEKITLETPCVCMQLLKKKKKLVCAMTDGSINLISLTNLKIEASSKYHKDKIVLLKVNEEQGIAITASADGKVVLWNISESGKILRKKTFDTGFGLTQAFAMFYIGQLVTYHGTNSVKVWSIPSGRMLKKKVICGKDEAASLALVEGKLKLAVFMNSGSLSFVG